MYRLLEQRLAQRVLECLERRHSGVALPRVVVDQPPKVELGDFAIPIFPFAKPLRSAPLKIAEAIRAEIGSVEGIAEMQVAPPGYLNVKIDRAWMAAALAADRSRPLRFLRARFWSSTRASIPTRQRTSGTCATPFSATHLFACCAMREGKSTFRTTSTTPACRWLTSWSASCTSKRNLAQKSKPSPASRASTTTAGICMRAFHSGTRKTSRTCRSGPQTLHGIEDATSEIAAIAELISIAVLRRHLETMDRLDIEYDFLPRESEILHLHFWDAAFTKLKESGVLTFESEGKNKGCWVMRRAGTENSRKPTEAVDSSDVARRPRWRLRGRPESHRPLQRNRRLRRQGHRLPHVEVRAARPRLRLSQVLPLSERARLLDFNHRWRKRSSPLRRRGRNLQRHRRPPVGSAEHRDRSSARSGSRTKPPTTTRTFPTRWSC